MKFNLDINSINYIKFIYKDNDGFAHCIKASIKKLNEREVFACAKYEEKIKIQTPQDIELSFACDNGLYKAVTKLKYIETDSQLVFFTIQIPDNIEYQQNREYFRIKTEEDALISYQDENGKTVKIQCETYDISANGIKITLDKQLSVDFPEMVQLTLFFPAKNINTNAQFVRKEVDEKTVKLAFAFVDLKENDADYISQICFKKQLENRRKNWL